MQIIHDVRTAAIEGPTFLSIGNFDGLHRGHQALIQRLRQEADAATERSGQPNLTGLLTFSPHPMQVLRPTTPIQLLTNPEERMTLAGEFGVDLGIVQPFNHEIANLSSREFVSLLVAHLGLAGLVVGPDFALGKGRTGTLDVLRTMGEEMGFKLVVVDEVLLESAGLQVRSLTVRQQLEAGNVARASALLGRHHRVSGVVEPGDGRGRTIGVPTANLNTPPERMLPANGVYATWAWLGTPGQSPRFMSATNIGIRPTVDGTTRRVESHLLDFPPEGEDGDLYGKQITLEFVKRLRGEHKFGSLDELVAQIHKDLEQARDILTELSENI